LVVLAAHRIIGESIEVSNGKVMALSAMISIVVAGLICVVVDILIVFWAWRRAAREPESRVSAVKPTPTRVASSQRDTESTSTTLTGLRWLLLCINLAVLILAFAFAGNQVYSMEYSNDFDYAVQLISKRYLTSPIFMMIIAVSAVLSLGVYVFVAQLVKSARR
jgi:hypothetical protein